MSERRFTDREVASILQRAVELEGEGGAVGGARGMSVVELQDIGDEVGIPRELIARAAMELQGGGEGRIRSLVGVPTVRREMRVVPGKLDRKQLAELVRVVDDTMQAQGTVTEALDSVRWTGTTRRLSRQVTFEPKEGETVIRVEERYPAHQFRVFRWVPPIWLGFVSWMVATNGGTGSIAVGTVFGVAVAVLLWSVVSVVLGVVSEKSAARVHDLAGRLSAAGANLVGPESDSPDPDEIPQQSSAMEPEDRDGLY